MMILHEELLELDLCLTKIFEVAKKEVGLDRFRDNVRMYYIKGHAVKKHY